MSRLVSTAKELRLKKLLGIRARLALLALILVAPLMLERARSLEETRNKQIAHAYPGILQSCPAQRRCAARSHFFGRDRAEIGGLYPAPQPATSTAVATSCAPACPSTCHGSELLIVGNDGRIQCATIDSYVGLDLNDRDYFKKARESRDLVFSDLLFAKTTISRS